MNTRFLPLSAWLLALGAGVALLIGALAHFDPANPAPVPPADPAPLIQDNPPVEAAGEPALPSDLSPGLSEIIKLAQAHVDENVILAYIKNSGLVFSPTADEILYLSDLGLSQDVIGALVKTAPPAVAPQSPPEIAAAPAPAEPPPSAIPPEPQSTAGAFYNDLAPYGAWVQQPDYGLCWQPTVETIDPDWRPYADAGQWLNSDSGWYWQSDYTWGWAVFHYGRWANVPRQGWVWVPGNLWAPAWVAWRSTPSYAGWAPLPPGAGLNSLAQLTYHSQPAGPNATFGLPSSAYTFVTTGQLTGRNLPRLAAAAPLVKTLAQNSLLLGGYAVVNHNIFNRGPGPEAVAAAARRPVPRLALRSVTSPSSAGLAMDRKTLAVYRPAISSANASPSAHVGADKPRLQASAEKLPGQEPIALAENDSAAAPVVPDPSISGGASVQLPPLRYAAPNSPPVVRQNRREANVASAPRLDPFNPSARQAATPRIAMESRPAQVESRPAQVELARSAPVESPRPAAAPVASSSSSGGTKSGK